MKVLLFPLISCTNLKTYLWIYEVRERSRKEQSEYLTLWALKLIAFTSRVDFLLVHNMSNQELVVNPDEI